MKLITDFISDIPKSVRLFAVKAVIIFVTWNILYLTLLRPAEMPDRQLTYISGLASAHILTYVISSSVSTKEQSGKIIISKGPKALIGIYHPCNGLEIYVLYVSFMLCLPTTAKRVLLFAIGGLAILFIMNLLRICGLAMLSNSHSEWLEINHKYVFKIVIYLTVLLLWRFYSKPINAIPS